MEQLLSLSADERPAPPYFVSDPLNPNQFFNALNDDGCVLLRDGKCLLHAHFGPEVKSCICRSFPAKSTVTPSGAFGSLYFACPSTLRNLEAPFRINVSESPAPISEFAAGLRFQGSATIPWAELDPISISLESIVYDSSVTLRKALLAGVELIRILGNQFKRSVPGPASKILDRFLPSIHDAASRRNLPSGDSLDAAGLNFLLRFTLQIRDGLDSSHATRPATFFAFIDTLKTVLCIGPDNAPSAAAIERYFAFIRLWREERAEFFQRELRNYFLWKIFEKESFVEYGILPGFHILCLSFALIRLYAFAVFTSEGREKLDFDSVAYPIRIVDRFLFQNKPFLRYLFASGEATGIENADLISGLL